MEIYVYINGIRKSLMQLSQESGVEYETIYARWKNGVPADRLVDSPESITKDEVVEVLGYVPGRKYARNLLDNSDFTHPVNQRGKSSYTGSGYSVDRWRAFHGDTTHTVIKSGLQVTSTGVNPNIYQPLNMDEIDSTKKYTAVYCDGAGDVHIWVGNINTGNTESPLCVYVSGERTLFRIVVSPAVVSSGVIKWAALYEGEYTAETLPEYQPKGYEAELAACQRYQYVVSGYLSAAGVLTGDKKQLILTIPTPVSMRAKPSVSGLTISGVRTTAGSNTTPTITSFSADSYTPHCVNIFVATGTFNTSTYTNNTPAFAYVREVTLEANL